MDPKNTRPVEGKKESDLEYYLKSGIPTTQVVSIMKQQGKESKEIDAFAAKYDESRQKVAKHIRKFVQKIEQKYGHLDIPELMKKGHKHASKNNFSDAEREAFVNLIMRGDTEKMYLPYQELAFTEMAKFLGYTKHTTEVLEIKPQDTSALNKIEQLFNDNRLIHSSIKENLRVYRSCAPEAIVGKFDSTKHNLHMSIHPMIVALFLTKIDTIENRMLISNIGRMVVQRAQPFLRKYHDLSNTYTVAEYNADIALAGDIARDPNSLNYFSEESPMSNLLKRFKIQIELWRNVLSLRQGNFYSKGDYSTEDSITSLLRILNTYEWTHFDSPEMYHVQDEGTVLRKLMAVFSMRPTFTQISSLIHQAGTVGYSNFGTLARTTFVNTPICNIRLPSTSSPLGGNQMMNPVNLLGSLQQVDYFIENKMMVPKHKQVIYSRDVIFFYINRRQQAINFASMNAAFRYVALPGAVTNVSNVNKTPLAFNQTMPIGQDQFKLRSAVYTNEATDKGYATAGCTSCVVQPANALQGRPNTTYWQYDPIAPGIMFRNAAGNFVRNDPIMQIPENTINPQHPGFRQQVRNFGTVLVYCKA
jgi:hypothetical protein